MGVINIKKERKRQREHKTSACHVKWIWKRKKWESRKEIALWLTFFPHVGWFVRLWKWRRVPNITYFRHSHINITQHKNSKPHSIIVNVQHFLPAVKIRPFCPVIRQTHTYTHHQMSFPLACHWRVSLYKQQGSLSDPLRGQRSGSQPGVAMAMASGELQQSGISSVCQSVNTRTHTHLLLFGLIRFIICVLYCSGLLFKVVLIISLVMYLLDTVVCAVHRQPQSRTPAAHIIP